MICMKKETRFCCRPRAIVGRQGPPGSARAQLSVKANYGIVGCVWFLYQMVEQCCWCPATCMALLVYCNKTLSLSLTSEFSNRELLCRAGSLVPQSSQLSLSVWRATEIMSEQGNNNNIQ